MKILLVGANGFIGSEIYEKLKGKAELTLAFRNEDSKKRFKVKYGYERDDITDESVGNTDLPVKFCTGSVTDVAYCDVITKNIDVIINLAGLITGDESAQFESNIAGFFNLASAAVNNGVSAFFYASSASVYGGMKECHRESDKTGITSFYSVSKIIDENLAEYFAKNYSTKFVGLRFFNPYGNSNIKSWDVTSKYFLAALTGKVLIVSNLNATRDFIYIKDVAEITAELIFKWNDITENIINVATGHGTKMLDLAKTIVEVTGSESEIILETEPVNIVKSVANVEIQKKYVNIKLTSLYDGISETYMKNKDLWKNFT